MTFILNHFIIHKVCNVLFWSSNLSIFCLSLSLHLTLFCDRADYYFFSDNSFASLMSRAQPESGVGDGHWIE